MTEGASAPVEVTSANFDEVVLGAPPDAAVVVDFWAPWCAPCRLLSPILERVVASYGPKAILAKANVEADPELAQRWAVQSIPAVKVFRAGAVVREFIGALGESRVRAELAPVIPSEAEDLAGEGDELMRKGDSAGAEEKFRAAFEADPSRPRVRVRLGQVLLERGAVGEAVELLSAVDQGAEEYILARALLAQARLLEACAAAGGTEACRRRLAEDGTDLDARYGLGCCLAAEGDHREGLEELLKVVEADKSFRDGAAKEAMVAVFSIIGQRSTVADEYRQRLSRLLY